LAALVRKSARESYCWESTRAVALVKEPLGMSLATSESKLFFYVEPRSASKVKFVPSMYR
jgi:hypothetical protein